MSFEEALIKEIRKYVKYQNRTDADYAVTFAWKLKQLLKEHIYIGQCNGVKSGWIPHINISVTNDLQQWLEETSNDD